MLNALLLLISPAALGALGFVIIGMSAGIVAETRAVRRKREHAALVRSRTRSRSYYRERLH